MMVLKLKEAIEQLLKEIEEDKTELSNVPERFKQSIATAIQQKETELISLQEQLQKEKEESRPKRIDEIISDFKKILNQFIENYEFKEKSDKEFLLSQLNITHTNDGFAVTLNEEDESEIKRKNDKEKFKVLFPNGKEISELKTTDTFVKSLTTIGLKKVERLELTVLGLPLIGNIKSKKYQQREVNNGIYVVTQISNDKKKNFWNLFQRSLNLTL